VTHPPSPEQQAVLDRIAAQRERLHARCVARQKLAAQSATAEGASLQDVPWLAKAAVFVREHPGVLAAVAGAALAAGPRRALRWAGVVLPLLLRVRR